jgi:ABC-type transport system substrate-binding protein
MTLVLAAALLSACSASPTTGAASTPSSTPVSGGSLTLAVPVSPATTGWDPLVADPATSRVLGPAVMATLLRPDPQGGTPTPWLAESATADPTASVWTIVLREGLRFSDGAALTPTDVVFLLEQAAADPALGTRFGADAEGTWFSNAVATDARTVTVTLRRGNSALDRLVLAAPEFGCVQAGYGGRSRADYYAQPPACGPFAIDPVGAGSGGPVALVRNAAYFAADQVLLDRITVSSGQSAQRTADMTLESSPGQAPATPAASEPGVTAGAPGSTAPTDRVGGAATPTSTASTDPPPQAPSEGVPTGETPTTAATLTPAPERWASDDVVLSPLGATAALVLRDSAPTSDANLRQALRACIDYAQAVAASPGSALPAAGLTPNGWPGAIEVPVPGQRLDIARLAVGLVPQEARSITLTFAGSDAIHTARAESIAADAARVGITIELRPRSARSLAKALVKGDFEAALTSIDPTVAHTAEISRGWALTDGFGGDWPPAPGQEAYPLQVGGPEEAGLAAQASARFEAVVRAGAWVIPVAIDPHRVGARPGVEGVQVGPDGSIPLDRVWLGSSLR